MILALILAAGLTVPDPADPPPDEVDPTEAGEAEARDIEARRRRAFGGPGSTPIQTLGGAGPANPVRTEELYRPPAVRPYEMPASIAEGLSAAPPAPPDVSEPVTVERYDRSYEGTTDAQDQQFQAGVESARLATETSMGPLDGTWTVLVRGRPAYTLILTDPAPSGLVEGAWRDLSAPRAASASGVLADSARDGDAVRLWFFPPGATEPSTLTVWPGPEGWDGEIGAPDGSVQAVELVPA